jgi:hypothetical protein
MSAQLNDKDTVTQIIKECHTSKETAEKIFKAIASDKKRTLTLGNAKIKISDEEAGEFVERFSSEVEPTLWESKRRKS